jgi:hypothetical protein
MDQDKRQGYGARDETKIRRRTSDKDKEQDKR